MDKEKIALLEKNIEKIEQILYNDIADIKESINMVNINIARLNTEIEWIKKLKLPVIFVSGLSSIIGIIYFAKSLIK